MMLRRFERRCRPRLALFGLLTAFLVLPEGCAIPSLSRQPENVIIILVDTLRADHLPAYGNDRVKTPNIDRFLDSAVLFEQARSEAACTFPSVNSMLTSRYPFEFISRGLPSDNRESPEDRRQIEILWQSANRPAQFGIPEDMQSLPEILKANGYHTIAVSASPIVRDEPNDQAVNQWGGYGRGFDIFHEECLNGDASCVNRAALQALDASPEDSPVFMYLHFMDPHDPYQAPEGFRGRYAQPYSGKPFIENGNPHPISGMLRTKTRSELDITDDEVQHLIDLYDEEIEYFDSAFGELVRDLESRGQLENSVLVFMSDHGESFLEHEYIAHCFSVYDSEIKIPLAFRFPYRKWTGGKRITLPVGLVDVTPTILRYLDIDIEDMPLEGKDLFAYIEQPVSGGENGAGEVSTFSAQRTGRSIATQTHKLIVDLLTGDLRLYRHSSDPAEAHNIATEHPDLTEHLRATLFDFLRRSEGAYFQEQAEKLSRKVEDKLRALGYIQ